MSLRQSFGPLDALPARTHVEIPGGEVTLIREGDRCFALLNRCPHANGRLGDGRIVAGTIVCPLHQWSFDLATGATRRDRRLKADVFPVTIEGGEVFVDLPGHATRCEPMPGKCTP